MRLICPRCGAQYEIDAGAIPPTGRDVECSACDHVWRAMPEAESFDPAERPALSRPLSESVIEILREEAARELEVRAAERRTQRAAERAGELAAGLDGPESRGQAAPVAEAEGGAVPAPGGVSGDPGEHIGGREAPGERSDAASVAAAAISPDLQDPRTARKDDPASWEPASSTAEGEAVRSLGGDDRVSSASAGSGEEARRDVASASPRPTSEGEVPRRRHTVEADAALGPEGQRSRVASFPVQDTVIHETSRARRRHAAGFSVAVMIALIAVALYALAPRVAGQGALGATLAEWRTEVDRGRDWLSLQGDAVTDSLRRTFQGE